MEQNFRKGLRDGIPICLGYLSVSFTFGLLGVGMGLNWWQTTFISLTNVTSAGQFAGLTLMMEGAAMLEMIIAEFFINLRYLLMSISLTQKVDDRFRGIARWILAMGVTDEIFGVSVSQKGKVSPYYNYGAMSMAIPGWTFGTLAGAISGSLLPEFMISALSVAIYGMFLAVIIPPAKTNKAVLGVVIAAMAVSSLFAVIPVLTKVSSGFVIIITTLLVAGAAAWLCPVKEEEEINEA